MRNLDRKIAENETKTQTGYECFEKNASKLSAHKYLLEMLDTQASSLLAVAIKQQHARCVRTQAFIVRGGQSPMRDSFQNDHRHTSSVVG
jgi:hypothetical protein